MRLETCLLAGAAFVVLMVPAAGRCGDYVGSKACGECHPDKYQTFSSSSKKAHSWHSVEVMRPKLKPAEFEGCLACHTTGYGKGGFRNMAETPELADVGCETCHGPGRAHTASGDPADISSPKDPSACSGCHNAERVGAFRFKPMLVSGAH